eukprot:CFRG7555T1
MLIEEFLEKNVSDPVHRKAIQAMFDASATISVAVRTASFKKVNTQNEFGDQQLAIDLLCDKIIFDSLRASGACATASSEERPTEAIMGGNGYSVAFDPLDGSSIIDTNFTVATIWGCWPGERLLGVCGREQSSAGIALYGPRTTVTLAVSEASHGHEFLLTNAGWEYVDVFQEINEGKLHAPGNLRAIEDNQGYAKLVQFWQDNKYQLRYTGGMAPDVNQLLVKRKGVFTNPHSKSSPSKLRCLFETLPVAYIVEKSGGSSSDGERSILDVKVTSMDQRMQVAYGSKKEIDRFEEIVGVKYI